MATIQLPAGPVSPSISPSNEYVGVPGKTIIKTANPFMVQADGVTMRGVTFDTGGVRQDGFKGLLLDNCILQNCHVGVEKNGGSDLTIRNCLWDHCGMTTWISDMSNLLIEQNEIVECGYGIKAFGNSTANKNRVYRRNWIHDCPMDFMAFELQGVCDGWEVAQNLIEKIRFGPLMADNDHALLMSVPMDQAKNGRIWGNAILGQRPRDAGNPGSWINGHPLLIEAGGDNTLIEGNIIDGGGTGISITDRVGSCSVTIKNNLIRNVYRNYEKNAANQIMNLIGPNDPTAVAPFDLNVLRALVGRATPSVPVPPPPTGPSQAQLDQAIAERDAARAKIEKALNDLK